MSLLKTSELRKMTPEERSKKLDELRNDLVAERGVGAMGGAPVSPGKIRAMRKNIARLLTVMREEDLKKVEPREAKE
ncbi:MAG: 50S ribosomal protein L29 [Thermoplasmata archaeon]|nr:50S ribosomal protein L29 [Thermoplasmata archaeon]